MLRAVILLWMGLLLMPVAGAVDFEALKASVVKISSQKPDGPKQYGTGFIVQVDGETAYIVTASHVIEGDASPQVEFFTARNKRIKSQVGRLEGNDQRGLAYLIVRDKVVTGKGVRPMPLNLDAEVKSGQEVFLMGFGQGQGDWAVIRANVVSMEGRDIRLDGRVEEGNSGGPIIDRGKVVGVVTQVKNGFGLGSPALIVNVTLKGWGVKPYTGPAFTEVSDELAKSGNTPPTKREVNPAPAPTPPAPKPVVTGPNLSGQYAGTSYSWDANGQQYVCNTAAIFAQVGNNATAQFQNNCNDVGSIQGQIQGIYYQGRIASNSLGYCDFVAEIQGNGASLSGKFKCMTVAGTFAMSRQ